MESEDRGRMPPETRLPLESVDITSELDRRPTRASDFEKESRAFALLLEEMANDPDNILRTLAETALELCEAHSAGLSILDVSGEETVFRWPAIAGRWIGYVDGTLPRNASPCGTVLDRNGSLLVSHPERHYPLPPELEPACEEVLLVPFRVSDRTVGTIWVVAHDESRKFDREDERLITSIGKFAATAVRILESHLELRSIAMENEALYESAKAANQARDDFFASLSHELRTPLTSVIGWASMLENGPSPETVAQASRAILSGATLQAQLVDDLLDISRITTGKFSISKENLDLSELVEEQARSVAPTASARGIALRSQTESVRIDGDRTRLRQMISNLLSNALKFTPAGGTVEMTLKQQGSDALLIISDTGEGIPAEFLARLFDRYSQLGEERHGGMGLGLSIVKHIVERHGGTVAAESSGPGEGSTFLVRLPVSGE